MKRIIIAGAGFAGISALKHLRKFAGTSPQYEIMVFDKNDYTTIIPSLPDVAANRTPQDLVRSAIVDLLPRNVLFKKEEITRIDLDAQRVSTGLGDYDYDYLLLCAGSVTNFYGFNQHLDSIFVVDSLTEALKIKEAFKKYLEGREACTLLISGAGFTGIEAACFLNDYARKNSKKIRVILIEKTAAVLGNLPASIGAYVEPLISDLGFEVVKNSSVVSFNGNDATLETGEAFKDVFFVWTSGTKRAIEDISGGFASLPDGRMQVNRFLQVSGYENVFAAGDCAAIKSGDAYLRKAVFFSTTSGARAGKNIVRSLKNMPLRKFRPIDPGWVIPLYPSSVGKFLGIPIRGRLGVVFYYLACGLRPHDLKSRIGYAELALKNLIGAPGGGRPGAFPPEGETPPRGAGSPEKRNRMPV
jgi:NADH:quinone reductase (non-electrogenic)